MRPYTFVLLSACMLACSAPADHASSSNTDTAAVSVAADSTLRHELLERVKDDQAVRDAFVRKQQQGLPLDSLDIARMTTVDTANTAWLRRVVAKHGWPGRSLVGADGANAAFLLVQHADRDTAFQAAVLPLMERAFAAGEVDGQYLALLTDRVATARGQPQIYGSQAGITNGHIVLKPIADSAGVDARRARVGLPPLAEYVRVLDSVYTPRTHR
jgi:hypothetical protein